MHFAFRGWGTAMLVAAGLVHAAPVPLMAPECISDPARAFVLDNVTRYTPPHPTLPLDHYYMIVRHLGERAIEGRPAFDFSRIPASYGWEAVRGTPLTGLAVPEPRDTWQRGNAGSADLDSSSAVQLHCTHAGSFINTWTFPHRPVYGGGPHTIYGYSFNDPPPPAIFGGREGSEFVLQAGVEIPWFLARPDPAQPPDSLTVGQVSLFVYLRDRRSRRTFAMLFGIYDNRFAGQSNAYAPAVMHDGATPFLSFPIGTGEPYAGASPYSAAFTGDTWSGLRFFRVHIGQSHLRSVLDDINAYCSARPGLRYCGRVPALEGAFSTEVHDYELTDFGVLHEVFRGTADDQLSMGVHVDSLGAWRFDP